ncbi:MAG TPA: FkbM family methyltransferase [Candidatus Babeliales bacterium]|nr:FkbM family methyltransferase [Candidatus Babeliales bacterium]
MKFKNVFVFVTLLTAEIAIIANSVNDYNFSFAILTNNLCELIKPKAILTTSLDFCGSTKIILTQKNSPKLVAIEDNYDFLIQVGRSLGESYANSYKRFCLIEEEPLKQISAKFLSENFPRGLDLVIAQRILLTKPDIIKNLLASLKPAGLALIIVNDPDNCSLDLNKVTELAVGLGYTIQRAKFYNDQIILISKSVSLIQAAKTLVHRAARKFYSQVGQDRWVYTKFFEQLGDNYRGTFVEIGAHDGVTHSNTLFFERELGWRGVCVEPRASAFKSLTQNRKCDCLQACITAKNEKRMFLEVEGFAAELSGLVDTYEPGHRNRIDLEISQNGGQYRTIEVDCIDFNTLCQRYNLKAIDFMSIDTEGCELEILRNIDFSKIEIKVIAIENNYRNPEIRAIMERNGFVSVGQLSTDDIYVFGRKL